MCNLKKIIKKNTKKYHWKWFDDISIYQTWIKILKAIIEPIALYGSEIWGPLKTQDFSKWEKEEIEIMHTQICTNILKVNRATPNNSSTSTWNAVIRALTRLKPCSGRSRTCRRAHFTAGTQTTPKPAHHHLAQPNHTATKTTLHRLLERCH